MKVQLLAMGLAIGGYQAGLAQGQLSLRQAQQMLKDKGFYSATVDGINGPGTRQAISDYQKSQGIPVTGKLDAQTAGKLKPAGSSDTMGSAAKDVKSAGTAAKSSGSDSVNAVAKEAKAATTKATAGTGSTVTGAVKEAGASAKSDAGSAVGEIKNVFGKPKPSSKPAKK